MKISLKRTNKFIIIFYFLIFNSYNIYAEFEDGSIIFNSLINYTLKTKSDTLYYFKFTNTTFDDRFTYHYSNYYAEDKEIIELLDTNLINKKRISEIIDEHKRNMYFSVKNMIIVDNLTKDSLLIPKLTGLNRVHYTKKNLVISNFNNSIYEKNPKLYIINNKTLNFKIIEKECYIMEQSDKLNTYIKILNKDSSNSIEYFKIMNDSLIRIKYSDIINKNYIEIIKNLFKEKEVEIIKLKEFFLVHLKYEENFQRIIIIEKNKPVEICDLNNVFKNDTTCIKKIDYLQFFEKNKNFKTIINNPFNIEISGKELLIATNFRICSDKVKPFMTTNDLPIPCSFFIIDLNFQKIIRNPVILCGDK